MRFLKESPAPKWCPLIALGFLAAFLAAVAGLAVLVTQVAL